MRHKHLIVLIIILLPIVLFFHIRGIDFKDEGYILFSAQRILDGQLPYRDFDFIFTPGSALLTALVFKIAGASVLASRIAAALITVVSSILIFKCISMPTKNKFYASLAALVFVAWMPTHSNFSWPAPYAISFALLTWYLCLKFLETRSLKYLSLSGFTLFSVFIFSQSVGLAMVIPAILFFLTKSSRNVIFHIHFLCGASWGAIIFLSYLLVTDSFSPFFIGFSPNPTTDIFNITSQENPLIFFLIPFLATISFILLYIRRRFHLLFLPAMILSLFIFETSTNYNPARLYPLLALSGIPLGLYIRYNISSNIRALLFLGTFLLIGCGFYKGFTANSITAFNADERLRIFTSQQEKQILESLGQELNAPGTNGYLYVDSFDQLIYYISKKNSPMTDSYLTIWDGPTKYYSVVLGNLVAKEVGTLVLRNATLDFLPIQEYVKTHYEFKKTIGNFDIYTRTR